MTNYREILRLSSLQYSQRTIESMAHCSRHTVRDVLQAASDCKFFSLRELNKAVAEKLKELNNRPFKQMAGCRRNAYLEEEKPYMLPLPASAYEPAVWSVAKVA